MPDISTVVTAERFSQGYTFQGYLDSIGENSARFAPHMTAFRLAPADAKFFKDTTRGLGGLKVLGIGEDWCPDVHRGLPVLARIAEAGGMELRFFPATRTWTS